VQRRLSGRRGQSGAQAARLLQQETGTTRGRTSTWRSASRCGGLGGGSSDAAAALRGLAELWDLRLPLAQLLDLAARLGSDVPFFVRGGTALAEGRGEKLTPLSPLPAAWVVVLTPPLAIPGKTGALYARLRPADYADGSATARLVEALRGGEPVDASLLVNSFEGVVLVAYRRSRRTGNCCWRPGRRSPIYAAAGPRSIPCAPTGRPRQISAVGCQAKGRTSAKPCRRGRYS